MTKAYQRGFIDKCAEHGVDGMALLKRAGLAGQGAALLRKYIGNLSGSRVQALEGKLTKLYKNFWNRHLLPGGKGLINPSTKDLLNHTDSVTRLNNLLFKARNAQNNARLYTGAGLAGLGGMALGSSGARHE